MEQKYFFDKQKKKLYINPTKINVPFLYEQNKHQNSPSWLNDFKKRIRFSKLKGICNTNEGVKDALLTAN
ncbi:hypothetical protein [Italian clover phyllody phytoplasma]|uniref:hypothetical protein n=1 Tax=Italian clover phyllody phytoplasma TaxID=1196420 RepID=UPI0002E8AC40|nr:hypothetical protein [Italian clover phyllody phytoplasma]